MYRLRRNVNMEKNLENQQDRTFNKGTSPGNDWRKNIIDTHNQNETGK